jgi:phosphatidylglycerol lysyltransferase
MNKIWVIQWFKTHFSSLWFWLKAALVVCILTLIYQFWQEGSIELPELITRLRSAHGAWLCVGVLLSMVFIGLQAEMYVWSFRSVQANIGRYSATFLFLKRNFVSVFLPGGSVSSLATFSQSIEKQGVTKFKVSIASSIYIISGLVTLWLVAVPAILYAIKQQEANNVEEISLLIVTLMLLFVVFFIFSVLKKNKFHQFLAPYFPNFITQLDTFLQTPFNFRALLMTHIVSLGLEIISILLFYVALRAIGIHTDWITPILAYTLSTLILSVAPVARGVGAVELSLLYILNHSGIDMASALTVTLIYRFFSFWLPLLIGGFSFINRKK